MENLPKDVLTLLLLDLDIDSVVSMCQTSSKFKNKICLNNYFWLNKLSHDFGLTTDLKSAKGNYFEVYNRLKTNPDSVYQDGAYSNNLKLVKLGLANGADVNLNRVGFPSPLMYSMLNNYDEIFNYLLDKAVYNKSTFILGLKDFADFYDSKANNEKALKKFFSRFIPQNIKDFSSPRINLALLNKFTEAYKEGHKYEDLKFYNEWIDYYRRLAE